MSIRLKQLKDVVIRAQENEKFCASLREEVTRVTESSVLVEDREPAEICSDALYFYDAAQRTGREPQKIKTSLLVKMACHSDANVRRLAASLLPEGQLYRFANDRDAAVRFTVAQRVPLKMLKEMVRRNPLDESLQTVYEERQEEGGMLYSSGKRLKDFSIESQPSELPEAWYDNLAGIIFNDIGPYANSVNMYNLARQFVQHTKATSGKDLNVDRLVDALYKKLEEHEDMILNRAGLTETVTHLSQRAALEEAVISVDEPDAVEELLESGLSGTDYINRAESLFNVTFGTVDRRRQRELIREGIEPSRQFPARGRIDSDYVCRAEERALDRYVELWNRREALSGSTAQIEWSSFDNEITFTVKL